MVEPNPTIGSKRTCQGEAQVEATKVKAQCKQAFSQQLKDIADFQSAVDLFSSVQVSTIKGKNARLDQSEKKVLKSQPEEKRNLRHKRNSSGAGIRLAIRYEK